MKLYLQFGWGMMEHTKSLVKAWNGGTVILSPRDLKSQQILKLASDIRTVGGKVWIDPQMYLPRSDHHRLTQHTYWPSDYDTSMLSGGTAIDSLFENLKNLNDKAMAQVFVIPGLYGEEIDDTWCAAHESFVTTAVHKCSDLRRFATVCVSGKSMRNSSELEILLDACGTWDVDGFYVVPEHSREDYLVDDPLWLFNLLLLTATLRRLGKEVVVGYCSHQMLCLAPAMADAICSGTWLNVRSFSPAKFTNPEENDKRRSTWYYCPQALSEFKITSLDMAFESDILSQMRPSADFYSNYATPLFSGGQPSVTAYGERESFRHYLQCLHHQVTSSRKATYQETLDYQMQQLDNAESLLEAFRKKGIRGAQRDFSKVLDTNRAALERFNSEKGFILSKSW